MYHKEPQIPWPNSINYSKLNEKSTMDYFFWAIMDVNSMPKMGKSVMVC